VEFLFDDDEIERANFYRLFSSLFIQEPADQTLTEIEEIFGLKFHDTSNEIRSDFLYLFSESEGHLLPFESLYNYPLWDKPRLWGKAAEEVQRFYQATGIVIDEETDLIPDHISAELLFMSYLIDNGYLDHQNSFLQNHLFVWIPLYCDEVQRRARTSFYKQIASLLREFIVIECEEFGIIRGQ
jgi:TorA maturation chaperone TorD